MVIRLLAANTIWLLLLLFSFENQSGLFLKTRLYKRMGTEKGKPFMNSRL